LEDYKISGNSLISLTHKSQLRYWINIPKRN
jgi:hypothetical protein